MLNQGSNLLSYILFIPIIGTIILVFIRRENIKFIRIFTLLVTIIDFMVSVLLFIEFETDIVAMQFVVKKEWIKSFGVNYHLGVDGISLLLVMLTTFLGPIVILSTWNAIKEQVKKFMILYLLLQAGILGVFLSMDFILFYIFWEGMLVPMYFLIGIWGGPKRIYAAVKYFLYTMFGGVLMLVGILALYYLNYKYTGVYTFDINTIINGLELPVNIEIWLFLAFGIAFAIKVPIFPFHTWLPDAHVEAPTAGSVILAGVLLKMGTYGFLRFSLPLFSGALEVVFPYIAILSVIGILYGAMVSMVQPDLKKLVAYSSVSHLGFVMLGIFSFNNVGIQGSIIQMINHGLSTGALFLIVGMIYERSHTRMIEDFGGLASQIPIFSAFFMIVVLSSLGLPGTNGFIGEFLILFGAFMTNSIFAILAALGIIFTAVYLLWMYQRVIFGKLRNEKNKLLKDLNLREITILVPIVILIFWIGVYPKTFLVKSEKSVAHLVKILENKREKRFFTNDINKYKIEIRDSKQDLVDKLNR
ncbi:NADH-quinone oxidoreductase subunit M [candidate division KSB1 bacterium]